MTRAELTAITECGHAPASDVALAIIAAAKVGTCNMELRVDMDTLEAVAETLGVMIERDVNQYRVFLSFMEVDANIYAIVNR